MTRLSILSILAAALSISAPVLATPTPLPPVTYNFAGECVMFCTGAVTGTLTLKDYVEGDDLFEENIAGFSFTHEGSTITLDDFGDTLGYYDGSDFSFTFDGWEDGNWRWVVDMDSKLNRWVFSKVELDLLIVKDPTQTAAVPEPASWAMMIGGFALAGAAIRRRRNSIAFG